jgi:hypothetical protein
MIFKSNDIFFELKKIILKEKKLIKEIIYLNKEIKNIKKEDSSMIVSQLDSLKELLKNENKKIVRIVENLNLIPPIKKNKENLRFKKIYFEPKKKQFIKNKFKSLDFNNKKSFSRLEKETVKRIWKKEKKVFQEEDKKINKYITIANKIFNNYSRNISEKNTFRELKKNLVKSNLQLVPKTYISIILFTLFISLICSLIFSSFFLFFNIGFTSPFITFITEPFLSRFLKIFWIPIVIPSLIAILIYSYPSMERKSYEDKINEEIPFATIHMSAISGSMVDPTKIFSILISTKQYPYICKEFTKLLNQINIYGYDLVRALRELSSTTANQKLSDLFNGLSTTISSGGDLTQFFEKRAESLLFDYKLGREKKIKSAETFMDIYISLVIAAPMIFMLLLMMMKISGLGISISSSMISLIIIVGVSMINIIFLSFLKLKQPTT